VDGIADQGAPFNGWMLGDLEPIEAAACLRIVLFDGAVGPACAELLDGLVKVTDVLLGPPDLYPEDRGRMIMPDDHEVPPNPSRSRPNRSIRPSGPGGQQE
jgi:hypothetical protein